MSIKDPRDPYGRTFPAYELPPSGEGGAEVDAFSAFLGSYDELAKAEGMGRGEFVDGVIAHSATQDFDLDDARKAQVLRLAFGTPAEAIDFLASYSDDELVDRFSQDVISLLEWYVKPTEERRNKERERAIMLGRYTVRRTRLE
jgi:hypothetical protein